MAEDGGIEASQQANTKLAVSRECVWFMVGACKVYSVIDDNDFGSPETNRDRISSEIGVGRGTTRRPSRSHHKSHEMSWANIASHTCVWVIKKDLAVNLNYSSALFTADDRCGGGGW